MVKPDTSFQFIAEWFAKAGAAAARTGKSDSAALWAAGLQHLTHFQRKSELADKLAGALRRAHCVLKEMSESFAVDISPFSKEHGQIENNAIAVINDSRDILAAYEEETKT